MPQALIAMTPRRSRWLFVNPYGVGDVLCSLPLVDAVRAAHPAAMLGYVCNRRTESMVHGYPGIHDTIVFEKDEYRALWRHSKRRWVAAVVALARQLRRGRWEVAIDLSLNWEFGAALAALRIPTRCGFDYRRRGRFLTHRRPLAGFDHRPVSDHYLDLLSLVGLPRPTDPDILLPVSEQVRHDAGQWLAQQGVPADVPCLAVIPGGGASWGPHAAAKQWPAQAFATLADRLLDTTAPGARLLLIGDGADHPVCEHVASRMRHHAIILEPAPSFALLGAVLTRCRLVVGNDSGVLHLAVAVDAPSVTIFGPANPVVYGPAPARADRHRVAAKSLACRPCYARFRLPPCPWNIRCLTTLDADDVYHTAATLLAA